MDPKELNNNPDIKPEVPGGESTVITPPSPPEKPVKEATVTIKQSEFERLLKTVESLSKDRDTLFTIADKGRLARAQSINGEEMIRQAKVSTYLGKYIVGWKLTKNVSEIMPQTGRWVEDQVTTVVFENGDMLEMPLIDFYRNITKESGDIISEKTETENGVKTTFFHLEFKNGKKLLIDKTFVN